jgi:RHS repeat-associated protein
MGFALLWGRRSSLTLTMVVILVTAVAVGLLAVPGWADPTPMNLQSLDRGLAAQGAPTATPGRELSSLRTASSDTYEAGGGRRVFRAFAHPVNYRDSTGAWQPIEDQLVPVDGGGWRTKASGVPVSLPSTLGGGGVSIGSGDQQVSLSLEGAASSPASVSGTTGTYQGVLPSTSASYSASATSVRETLTLADAQAPTVYRYSLSPSAGLHAALTQAGTVEISDSAGHTVYRLAAPTVKDSASGDEQPLTTPVHYELSADGRTLSLVLDSSWLHSDDRVFPVQIDPDISWIGAEEDCTIRSGASAGTSLCGQALTVGSNSATPREVSRTLLRVSVAGVPQDADILSTSFGLWFRHESSTTPVNMQAFALSREFTGSATWNTYDGVHSWSTAGGDFTSQTIPGGTQPYGERSMLEWYLGYWTGIAITPLVEKWVREPSSNHGVLLKAQTENTGFYDEFNQTGHSEETAEGPEGEPSLVVVYTPVLGAPSSSTITSIPLSDQASMGINVANGNLLISHQDVHLPGIGYDFGLTDTYNSEETGEAEDDEWPEGGYQSVDGEELNGTTFSSGADVTMERYWVDESRIYHDPTGGWETFIREPSADSGGNKAYLSPAGLNATLVVNSEDEATLTYNTSRVKYEFAEGGRLEKIVDPNGNTTTFHYNAEGKTSSVVDTHGHTVTFAYEGGEEENYISKISDELGRHWKFSENSQDQISTASDPDGHEFKYEYNAQDNPKQITDPRGHLIEISYDSEERVNKIRRVVNGTATTPGSKDVITTYAYSIPVSGSVSCPTGSYGDTEVVSPNGSPNGEADSKATGHKTFYCFNNQDQVTKTIDQAGNASETTYDSAIGKPETLQSPGDKAAGATVMTKIKYNSTSGAIENIVDGTGEGTSLTTSFNYGSGTGFHEVEPISIQTPFSEGKQKSPEHTTFFGYNATGNITSINQGAEKEGHPELKIERNSLGQPTETTDGDGNKTKYEYNAKHDLIKITPPSPLGATELTYDTIDRVHTVKDGRGITATYTYDGEDRVTKVEYSDGSSVSFEFNADGDITKRTDAAIFGEPYTGVTSYENDNLNRPITETTPTGKTIKYEYDYDSNPTSIKDTGGTVSYTYGSNDVLLTATEPGNSSHPFKFGYETGDDNRESTLYPNGILECSKTDAAGRLTSFRAFKPSAEQNCASAVTPSSTLEDYELKYKIEPKKEETIDSPVLQELANLKAATQTIYTSDPLNRTRKAVIEPAGGGTASLTSSYKYDDAGNMTENHTFSPTTTYSQNYDKYNAANEICAIASSAPAACASPSEPGIAGEPTYDADGDMTSDGSTSPAKFSYTERDQLASVTPHGGSATAIVSHGTGQEDLAAIGTEEVIQSVLGVASTGTGASASYYTRGSEGQLFAKRKPGEKPTETQYYIPDPFGSPAMLTSSTGTQTAPASGTYQYDPYGKPIGTGPATFGYRSGLILPDGLLHYGARYYDPANANWTQQDPLSQIGSPTQEDRFVYAGSDPINFSDPTGAKASSNKEACAVAGGGVGVVVSTVTDWEEAGVVTGEAFAQGCEAGVEQNEEEGSKGFINEAIEFFE